MAENKAAAKTSVPAGESIMLEITLPPREIHAADLMDRAIAKLRTARAALSPENKPWLDDETVEEIGMTIALALEELRPIRDRLCGGEA